MAVFASRGWTGFVGKDSYVASQEFNRKAGEGREQAALRWSGPLQSQMARSCTALGTGMARSSSPGGVARTMMTSLAVANAVMMSICSSLSRNICGVVGGHAFLATRSVWCVCPKPDSGRRHVGFNTTGHLEQLEVSKPNHALTARGAHWHGLCKLRCGNTE
nr:MULTISPECIES: FixH family protein [Mesorhizobium]